MKKIYIITSVLLMGVILNMNAQREIDYSLEGIGKTLNKYKVKSLGEFHDGLAWIKVEKGTINTSSSEERVGYINKYGEIVIPCEYSDAKDFSEGLACVSKSGNISYIDKHGNVVISMPNNINFYQTGNFSEGLAMIGYDGENGLRKSSYINKQGEFVIKNIDGWAQDFHNGKAVILQDKGFDGVSIYAINKKGEKVMPNKPYKYYGVMDKYIFVRDENRYYGVMDINGDLILPCIYRGIDYSYSEGCFIVYDEEGCKFINTKGEQVISTIFESAQPFSEGIAAVRKGKWGYINREGEIIIPMQYDSVDDFNDGYAYVIDCEKGRAVIDRYGNQITPFTHYDSFYRRECNERLFVVKKDGKWGYADIYGNSTFNSKANPFLPKADRQEVKKVQELNSDKKADKKLSNSNDEIPLYWGGDVAMKKYFKNNTRYPAIAKEQGLEGDVHILFKVDLDGTIYNVRIAKSTERIFEKEATRVIKNMPRWKWNKNPNSRDNQIVIHFSMNGVDASVVR